MYACCDSVMCVGGGGGGGGVGGNSFLNRDIGIRVVGS